MELNELIERVHAINLSKGWYDDTTPRSMGDNVALLHSEASEILEEHRNGHAPTEIYYSGFDPNKPLKPEGIPIELADLQIRIADFAKRYDIDLPAAVEIKLAYNATRPYRHGEKVI